MSGATLNREDLDSFMNFDITADFARIFNEANISPSQETSEVWVHRLEDSMVSIRSITKEALERGETPYEICTMKIDD